MELDGLGSVRRHGGGVILSSNTRLEEIGALRWVRRPRSLIVAGNRSLKSLDALRGVESVDQILNISTNSSLRDLNGLSGLREVGGWAKVTGNGGLMDVSGLDGLERVGGDFSLRFNRQLGRCACALASLLRGRVGGAVLLESNGRGGDCEGERPAPDAEGSGPAFDGLPSCEAQ